MVLWIGTDSSGKNWRIVSDGNLCILEDERSSGWHFNARSDKAHLMSLGECLGVNWTKTEEASQLCQSISCQGPWYRDHQRDECK